MKLIIVTTLLVFAEARIAVDNCDGVIIHNIKYEQQVLQSNISTPYQLAIDYNTNTLFFSITSAKPDTSFESAYINLKTNEFKIIEGIDGGFANAVDEMGNIVYLGGRNGIYKFNYETKTAERIDGTDDNIWQMFFKNTLYYSKYPEEEVYTFEDNKSDIVPELSGTRAMLVAIDDVNNIYFSNSSGLFVYKKSKDYISYIGNYNLNGFTSDISGKLFFSTPSGIYFIDDNKSVKKITSINDVYGVAIESDGSIIYASLNSLIRLKPTKTYCYNNEEKNSMKL